MAYEEIEKESIGCLLRFLRVAVTGVICLILANYFFVIRPFMNEMFVAFSKEEFSGVVSQVTGGKWSDVVVDGSKYTFVPVTFDPDHTGLLSFDAITVPGDSIIKRADSDTIVVIKPDGSRHYFGYLKGGWLPRRSR